MNQVLARIQKGLKSNKGFTFVELLSSLAIFAFFSIALLQYMKTASSVQAQVGASVKLETEAQLAMSTVEEFLVDASASVVFEDARNTLFIINNKGYGEATASGTPVVHAFKWYPADYTDTTTGKSYNAGEVYYYSVTSGVSKKTTTTTTTHILRTNVDDSTIIQEYEKVEVVVYLDGVKQAGASSVSVKDLTDTTNTLTDIPLITATYSEERTVTTEDFSEFSGLTSDNVLTNPEKLCENVTDFKVTLDISGAGRIVSATLSFEMSNYREASYTKDLFIVLRNNPPEGLLI